MDANKALQALHDALETSPEFFRHLIEVMPITVCLFVDRRVAYANKAAQTLFEADSREQVLGLSLADFIHPLDLGRAEARFRRSETTPGPNPPIEIRLLTLKGNPRLLTTASTPVFHQGNRAVLVVAMDITHRLEMEQQLRESEQNFRRLFENMQDVYYRTDAKGIVRMVGPAVRKVLGYEPGEIVGRGAEEYYPTPSDRDALKAAIREHGSVADFPGQMVRKDGRIIDISISSHCLYDDEGNFAGVEGIYRDVTERKMLERELRRLATTDSLTGITNRRAFLEQAQRVLRRCQRYGTTMVLLILDLDHFKSINDRHGHIAGDAVLRVFVDAVQEELRETDLFGRLGGEEFCVVLQETQREDALRVAERIRTRVAGIDLQAVTDIPCGVTVSIGATANRNKDNAIERLLERADKALYEAKSSGRNRVVWFQD